MFAKSKSGPGIRKKQLTSSKPKLRFKSSSMKGKQDTTFSFFDCGECGYHAKSFNDLVNHGRENKHNITLNQRKNNRDFEDVKRDWNSLSGSGKRGVLESIDELSVNHYEQAVNHNWDELHPDLRNIILSQWKKHGSPSIEDNRHNIIPDKMRKIYRENLVKVKKIDDFDYVVLVNGVEKSRSTNKKSAENTANAYRRILDKGESID